VNAIELIEKLKGYPVFDLATFESMGDMKHESARLRLFRLKQHGYVHRLQRDSYTVFDDPLIIASRMTWPSYISLWYALNYHGLTTQLSHSIQVLTTRKVFRSEIEFENMRISFIKINPKFLFGYDKIRIGTHDVFMALPEKAILDGLMLGKVSVSEIFDILKENIAKLDIHRFVEFIRRCGNSALAKRMGFMLDVLGRDIYADLHKLVTPTILTLDPGLPKRGVADHKWRILDNLKKSAEV
jgi:predicted transcriptional regulator of viral defense system